MKGLNKIALVAAIAAAPLAANAELKALNDSTMSNLTGQAGVTIELQTKVDIGKVIYTDEGSLEMAGVHVGGGAITKDATTGAVTGVDGNLDDLVADIDINADGDAVIDVHSVSGLPIDYAMAVESVSLVGTTDSTVLASNIGVTGLLSALNLTVDTATDTLIATVGFSVENMDMDVDFLAVGIRGLSIHGTGYVAGTTTMADAANYAGVVATVGSVANTRAASGQALSIGLSTFAADVNIAGIEIGGTSIGSLKMDDMVISNTSMQVYGH